MKKAVFALLLAFVCLVISQVNGRPITEVEKIRVIDTCQRKSRFKPGGVVPTAKRKRKNGYGVDWVWWTQGSTCYKDPHPLPRRDLASVEGRSTEGDGMGLVARETVVSLAIGTTDSTAGAKPFPNVNRILERIDWLTDE
ncbi:hypothetical protein FA10DRAFT_84950 [Acaromyces ingoldii]|uniref:Uncharacterized protein n=1 Tax=Acaromyces ingoldii TaxID=215250 RepID=A0A316YSX4_9BASI|nr:hypothetical protein FA10DRAFT_84950 [Acaromyces ingoldii]PWN92136.1 hypothetical protein FA10DRAFT_84950 [Acaromyces ingoldii]